MTIRRLALLAGVTLVLLGACDETGPPGAGNHKPRSPVVAGPSEALVGERLDFSVMVFDPDGDRLRVFVAWGDGDTSDYGEFILSGAEVLFEHVFREPGVFYVAARCHDLEPKFSDWSSPRAVSVARP